MLRTQQFRQLAVSSPLGEDVLLLRGFSGRHELGRPFEYELDLLSEQTDVAFNDIVGHNVTVRVQPSVGEEPRFFNGYVSSFELAEPLGTAMVYRAKVVPWLWFLTRTSDCRVFQQMTVPDIIKQVFRDFGFCDFEDRLSGTYRTWEYCVQYCETAFDFVSRLMEQEGIYYFFLHEEGKHTLVFADGPCAHDAAAGYEEIQYRPSTRSLREREYIHEWRMRHEVQPGMYCQTDFDFANPRKELLTASMFAQGHPAPDYEVFEYPGEYVEHADGESYARRRMEEYQARYEVAEGSGEVRGIATGHRFALTEHPRADQCKEYLVTSTYVQARSDQFESGGFTRDNGEGGMNFTVSFTAIDAVLTFRMPRRTPKPLIRGPQTAFVVGPADEEIYTDEYGRVKVLFHWDRYAEANENSSCWIRVAQAWAGKKWGMMFVPRIGQEVIVEFLEGDPDRPIITGRVYNGQAMPPYALPDYKTMSTIKTNSSKGGEGFNELRFEDKKGSEQVFLHAERNQDTRVKNDCFEWIGNNRHLIIMRDQFEHVENNRHEIVDMDHMEEIGKDRHLKVAGKEAKEVAGSHSFTVTGDVIEVFKSSHSEQTTQSYYVKAMDVVIEAMTSITLKVGGSSVVVDSSGVTATGPTVTIDGGQTKINSGPGSSPGSGQAGSAVAPAAPTEAEEADTANPGEICEPPEGGVQDMEAYTPDPAKTSWIEIELVDEEENPVPGEWYRITLPDGQTVAEGTLDDKGFARVDRIDPGICQITFPNLDQDAWEDA